MSRELTKCRITVLKTSLNQELIDEYLEDEYRQLGPCECFTEGQEILIQDYSGVPPGFCASAWADIRKDMMAVAMGADMPGIKPRGTLIVGCTDWFRPVIFKLERIEEG